MLKDQLKTAKKKAAKFEGSDRDAKMREVADLAGKLAAIAVPAAPRLWTSDCTAEALSLLLQAQGGRMAVLSAEGGVFGVMAGLYSKNGAPNIDVYLKGHAGDDHRVDRVGRPSEVIRSPALTMGLTVQPDVLHTIQAAPGFRGRGLLGRFCYALPRSPLGSREQEPPPVDPAVRARYALELGALLRLQVPPQGHQLQVTPEAAGALVAFRRWIEPQLALTGDLSHMLDWAGKLHGAVARIAALLHLAAASTIVWSEPVSLATMEAAIRIGHYLIPHAKAAFDEMGADAALDGARRVLAWLERTKKERVTVREVYQGMKGAGRFRCVGTLDAPMRLLAERGYLRLVEAEYRGRGRPRAPSYEVHPLVFAG